MSKAKEESKKHYRLSPSAAHRWFECAGEPAAREGAPRTTSVYADEGTTAHWIAEKCLTAIKAKEQEPAFYIGQTCPETGMKVDESYVEHVQTYLDETCPLMAIADHHGIETEGALTIVHSQLGGTCDFWAYHADTRTLYVRDLKYGAGKVVEVEWNPQLLVYAANAAFELSKRTKNHVFEDLIDTVDYGIVQPRAGVAPVRTHQITGQELAAWTFGLLRERARATDAPDAPRKAGKWCTFCPALATCHAVKDKAAELAEIEFSDNRSPVLPLPATLDIDKLAKIAAFAPILSDWAGSAKAALFTRLANGETHPLWKIVSGREGNRKWAPEAPAIVEKMLGKDAFEKPALKSPATVEKELKSLGIPLPKELVVRTPGQPCLAAVSDPRPALANSPEKDFGPANAGDE